MADILDLFACRHCGQRGVVWRDNSVGRELARVSNGFHVEEQRFPDTQYVIVCDVCDEIDPARVIKV